jgi:hypothetical protein
MCDVLLPPGVNTTAVKYIYIIYTISYIISSHHILSYRIISYHIVSYHIISLTSFFVSLCILFLLLHCSSQRARVTNWGEEKCIQVAYKRKRSLAKPSRRRCDILELIPRMSWNGFIWLRIVTTGVLLWARQWNWIFHIMWGFLDQAQRERISFSKRSLYHEVGVLSTKSYTEPQKIAGCQKMFCF